MTVTLIGEAQAKLETTEAMRDFLISIMPIHQIIAGVEDYCGYKNCEGD